ncbi:MAG: hypothetical protein V4454_16910 [Pseudomonadota bacterium]
MLEEIRKIRISFPGLFPGFLGVGEKIFIALNMYKKDAYLRQRKKHDRDFTVAFDRTILDTKTFHTNLKRARVLVQHSPRPYFSSPMCSPVLRWLDSNGLFEKWAFSKRLGLSAQRFRTICLRVVIRKCPSAAEIHARHRRSSNLSKA